MSRENGRLLKKLKYESKQHKIPALGILMERIVLTLPSHPSTLMAVAVENNNAGPTQRRDLK